MSQANVSYSPLYNSNAAQSLGMAQGLGQAIGGTGGAMNQWQAQAQTQAYSQMQQQAYAHVQSKSPRWMFNGKFMNFNEFVDVVFPEDTPEKTMFILKHSGDDK
jgi:hypothetical protein